MRKLLFLLFAGVILILTSCRNDFAFEPSSGGLKFSKDTVYLDTVFTNIGSSTYTLKVYNRSDKDISIPQIKLGKGENSKYRIMVDGLTGEDGSDADSVGDGKIFNNVEILAKDSLFIFIEVTSDVASANPTDFLYTDQIQFSNVAGAPQKVELVTLIQDAIFLYPQRFSDGHTESLTIGTDEIYGFYLDENDHNNEYYMTKDKPYVIYGYAAVPANKTLTIEAGARIYFHDSSGIIVGNNGSLHIKGIKSITDALENEVIMEGDRLEPEFSDVPGQWGTIWLTQGSKNNVITNCTIKNSTIGLYVSGNTNLSNTDADLKLMNTQIYNCSNYGILSYTGYIDGNNTVINNCGQYSLCATYGGKYNFIYCTFNNNWTSSKQLAVYLSDYVEGANPEIQPLTLASFKNCIIYGANQIEFLVDKHGTDFNYYLDHCLIKFNNISNQYTNNVLYNFNDTNYYKTCRIASNSTIFNPQFKNSSKNQFQPLTVNSGAYQNGVFVSTQQSDILGNTRSATSPDIGAYNVIP